MLHIDILLANKDFTMPPAVYPIEFMTVTSLTLQFSPSQVT